MSAGRDPFALPTYRHGPNRFAEDKRGLGTRTIIATLLAHPELIDDLLADTFTGCRKRQKNKGPKDGKPQCGRQLLYDRWILPWIAFCLSGTNVIKDFVEDDKFSSDELWEFLGLPRLNADGTCRPNYWTAYDHFRKLYEHMDAMRRLNEKLDAILAANDPQYARTVVADATIEVTAAVCHHDCKDGECPTGMEGKPLGELARAPKFNSGDPGEINHLRHVAVDAGDHERSDEIAGDAARLFRGKNIEVAYFVWRQTGNGVRRYLRWRTRGSNKKAGHWYLCRDLGVGVRAYEWDGNTLKAWVGRYAHGMVCACTGLTVARRVYRASEAEHYHHFDLVDDVKRGTGRNPDFAMTDAACSINDVTAEHTRRDIVHITPTRTHVTYGKKYDLPEVDRHHNWRCKHCGHPTRRQGGLRYPTDGGAPYLKVRCTSGLSCSRNTQQIHLSPQRAARLLPIGADDPRYLVRAHLRQSWERQHKMLRQRHGLAAQHRDTAPPQVGMPRAIADNVTALVVDKLRYLLRRGILKAPPGVPQPKIDNGYLETYERLAAELVRNPGDVPLVAWAAPPLRQRASPPARRHRAFALRDRAARQGPPAARRSLAATGPA